MIKKLTKVLLITCVCLFVFTSCGKKKKEKETASYELWSTYNTTKVIQQTNKNNNYQKLSAELNYEMMMDETEGAQVIITALKDINSYNLTVNELTSKSGNKISTNNISVYNQKYVKISRNYNGGTNFTAGECIPDILLPMDKAVSFSENKITANSNQGITVEIDSTNVTPDTYTGNFTLTIDGKNVDIPVNVTVWNIEYTGRRTYQTCFMIYRDELPYGEYDNSKEMVDAYIKELQNHKLDAYVVRDTYEAEHFTEYINEFKRNESITSIVIPVDFPLSYVATYGNEYFQETLRYITELAIASTEEFNLADFAYFYPSTYDEADIVAERQAPSERFFADGGEYEKTLELCITYLQDNSTYMAKPLELRQKIEESIRKIPAVFTNVSYTEKWINTLDATFCPYVSEINDVSNRERYLDQVAERANGNFWLYSCNATNYPYPTFDIDDYSLGLRVNGWISKKYNVTGYLYYDVCKYCVMFGDTPNAYIDVYGDPNRNTDANGDGYLFYPGTYYGLNTPIASLRLKAFRDGIDDFDMLEILEKKINDLSNKYNYDIDFDLIMKDYYNTLFDGSIVYEKIDETFYNVRRQIANLILSLDNEDEFIAFYEKGTDNKTVTFLANKNTINVNNETLTGTKAGNGYKFTINFKDTNSKDFNIVIGNNQYNYSVKGFNFYSTLTPTLSTGSVMSNGVITIKSIGGRYAATEIPFISIPLNNLKAASSVSFTYENLNNTEFKIAVYLMVGSVAYNVGTSYCQANNTRYVEFNIPKDIDMTQVTSLKITFANVDSSNKLLPDKNLKLSNLWFEFN